MGGAILNNDGILDVAGSTFNGNQAIGGSSTDSFGGTANGGAIITFTSVLDLTSDSFVNNKAVGGSSPMGAEFASGGAVNIFEANFLADDPTSYISNTVFAENKAVGGSGGGPLRCHPWRRARRPSLRPSQSVTARSSPTRQSADRELAGVNGTEADGGAVWAGYGSTMTIQGSVIAGNEARRRRWRSPGGTGGDGGDGAGGGIAVVGGESLTITGTTIVRNRATGGAGGQGSTAGVGGNGLGGGSRLMMRRRSPSRAVSLSPTSLSEVLAAATATAAVSTRWEPPFLPTRS